ncbi:MAG: hypothetical protein M5U23_05500 [Acidimicrobiia bacterium]|nr:hypothetical protein [Acidimicrobiia bacterium]
MERFLPTLETLRNSSDDELDLIYSEAVESANNEQHVVSSVNSTIAKATFVREELHRRAIERSGNRIECLTWVIAGLTVFNVILVAFSVFD